MAKDTLDQVNGDTCSEECGPQDSFLVTAQEISDKLDNIMGASSAQEIPGWQGRGLSPFLSELIQ